MNITKLILRLKMGLDTVSLSTKKNMYTVYRDWRYSDTKLDFKSYLLEKDERIEAFANSFKQYNSGDMFTRETVVELEDGRLLCFDPDEFSKAYLIDLSDVTKDDIKFDMKNDFKMIKADKTKAGYETRNTAILSYLGSDIKTKDGLTLDDYLLQKQSSEETSTTNNAVLANKFYYKNISQMSNDEEEQEYYKNLITSLGSSVDNGGKITIGEDSALSKLNEKIRLFEKYMSKDDNQSKLDTLVLLQQLGLSELELIEKLSPGFLEQVKTFTSGFESVSYTDDNGFSTSISQVINFEKVITYKYNNAKNYWMYLSLDDRKSVYNSTKNEFGEYNSANSIETAAQNLTTLKSTTSEKLNLTMGSNLEDSISEYTINKYINEFTSFFNDAQNGLSGNDDVTYDKALEYLAKLCSENVSGEYLYRFLQDKKVQKCLVTLGVQKGSLATVTTADKPEEEQMTVEKVYLAMVAKINAYSQEAYTLMGDKERLEAQNAVNSTIAFMDAAGGGLNITYNENQGWMAVGAAGAIIPLEATKITWSHLAEKSIVEGAVNTIADESIEFIESINSATNALNKAKREAAKQVSKKADKKASKVATKIANEAAEKATNLAAENFALSEVKETLIKCYFSNTQDIKTLIDSLDEEIFKTLVRGGRHKKNLEAYKKRIISNPATFEEFVRAIDNKNIKLLFEQSKFRDSYKKLLRNQKLKVLAGDNLSNIYNKTYNKTYNKEYTKIYNQTYNAFKEDPKNIEAAKQKLEEVKKKNLLKQDISTKHIEDLEKEVKTKKDTLKNALKEKIGDVDSIGLNQKQDKDLIKKLKNLNKGKTVDLTSDDIARIRELKLDSHWSITDQIDDLENATKNLKSAKTLQTKVKDGIRNSIKNQEFQINRHGSGQKNGIKGANKKNLFNLKFGKTNNDVGTAIGKSATVTSDGAVDFAENGLQSGMKKASKKSTKKTTEKTASTAAKALRLGGALSKVFMAFDCASAAIDGGTMGYGIAAWAVESNPQNFTNADGSYDTTRANVAKALGAASGACIGFAVGMWSSGVGAAINVATGGVAGTVIGGIAAGVGVLLGAASAVTCFTKWFK